jgi:hypothetical protein
MANTTTQSGASISIWGGELTEVKISNCSIKFSQLPAITGEFMGIMAEVVKGLVMENVSIENVGIPLKFNPETLANTYCQVKNLTVIWSNVAPGAGTPIGSGIHFDTDSDHVVDIDMVIKNPAGISIIPIQIGADTTLTRFYFGFALNGKKLYKGLLILSSGSVWNFPTFITNKDIGSSENFKRTGLGVNIGTGGAYGPAVSITSLSGVITYPRIKIAVGGTFGTGETVTVKVEAVYSDGSTAYVEKSYTAVKTEWLTDDDIEALITQGKDITQLQVSASSNLASTSVTVTVNAYGKA